MRLSETDDLRNDIDTLAKKDVIEDSANQRLQIHTSLEGRRRSTVVVEKEVEVLKSKSISTARLPSPTFNIFDRLDKSDEIQSNQKSAKIYPRRNQMESSSGHTDRSNNHHNSRERSPNNRCEFQSRGRGHTPTRGQFNNFRGRGRGSRPHFRQNQPRQQHDNQNVAFERRRSAEMNRDTNRNNTQRIDDRLHEDRRRKMERIDDCLHDNGRRENEDCHSRPRERKTSIVQVKEKDERSTTKPIGSDAINHAIHEVDDTLSSKTTQWKPTPMPELLQMARSNSLTSTEMGSAEMKPTAQQPRIENRALQDEMRKDEKPAEKKQPKIPGTPSPTTEPTTAPLVSASKGKEEVIKGGENEREPQGSHNLIDEENESDDQDGSKSSEQEATSSSSSSSSSEEERVRRKKSNKKSKKHRRRRKKSVSSDSSGEDDSESEDEESDRDRKKRRKHKKKKHRKKSSTSKKKKKRNKKSSSSSAKSNGKHIFTTRQLAAMEEKIREEVLEKIKGSLTGLPIATVAIDVQKKDEQSLSSNNNNSKNNNNASSGNDNKDNTDKPTENSTNNNNADKTKSDSDSLELDYSSEEPYDEHGFHTGLSKKNSPDPSTSMKVVQEMGEEGSKKEIDGTVKENVLAILDEEVEDLDYDLEEEEEEESTAEENWKRQKKEEGGLENTHNKSFEASSKRDSRRTRPIRDFHRKGSGVPCFDARRREMNPTEWRRESEARRRAVGELRRRERNKATLHPSKAAKTQEEQRQETPRHIQALTTNNTQSLSPKEIVRRNKPDHRRDERLSNNINKASSSSMKDVPVRKRPRRSPQTSLELPPSSSATSFKTVEDTTTPSDGIAMAKEIRHNVYKTNTFWREPVATAACKSFDPRNNVLVGREDNFSKDLLTCEDSSSIGKRLQKIADVATTAATIITTTTTTTTTGGGFRREDTSKEDWNPYSSSDTSQKR